MPRIGAHVSSAGGCSRAFDRAEAIQAEALQLFLSPPQRWKEPAISDAERESFRRRAAETKIPAFAHAAYLVNLASPDEGLVERSIGLLRSQLTLAGELGIEGLIFHVGSHLGAGFESVLSRIAEAIRDVLEGAPGSARLVIENNAGQGGGVGTTFAEVAAIIEATGGNPRLAFCLDTCHALAGGYDMTSREGVDAAIGEIRSAVGLDRLLVIHANDSKTPLGSLRDRHENIGEGFIGLSGFSALMAHPSLADVPYVMEVPGLSGVGPDAENVIRLKAIREGIAAGSARA